MKIIYSCDFRKLSVMYLLEKNYNINKFSLDSLIESELREDRSVLKSIKFIISADKELEVPNSIILENGTSILQQMSLYDALEYIKIHPDEKCLSKIIWNEFPMSLIKGYVKNDNHKSLYDPCDPVEKNISNSIFFYEALEKLDRFILLNYDKNLSKILPITVRIYIPKEYFFIEYFNKNNIIYRKPLFINNHLVYESFVGLSDIDRELMKELTILSTQAYNALETETVLSNCVVYNTVLSLTIEEWSSIITRFSDIETNLEHPVMSAIPYFLKDYKGISKLLDIDQGKINKILGV